ncbi:hypothetical protein LGH83_04450 [Lichenihabitans sp. PAMC28606]|uniref:hypothetical protein n=1 Tax=Lichenihabitans sp. PAMC28606 TaxID=2880932 RepID=UPI001D0A3BB5|nr:hypothetical protein [Lichenihabitans sp. PAMC28606]UDL95477.1 hypothetical protein LGH83_04450 [Lichenihabitans sp. PAMC28606]
MSEAIAFEIQTICRRAAEPVAPGESIKAQLRRAWVNLGRPPMWRLRAGWYSDNAGNWSAAAVADFQSRYLALIERKGRTVEIMKSKADLIAGRTQPKTVELAFDEYRTLVSRIEAIETALRVRG